MMDSCTPEPSSMNRATRVPSTPTRASPAVKRPPSTVKEEASPWSFL